MATILLILTFIRSGSSQIANLNNVDYTNLKLCLLRNYFGKEAFSIKGFIWKSVYSKIITKPLPQTKYIKRKTTVCDMLGLSLLIYHVRSLEHIFPINSSSVILLDIYKNI